MKTNPVKFLTLALFAVAAMTARAEVDVITKTFPIKAGGKLTVDVDRGSIHITTSDSDKVDVKITRELKLVSAAEAKDVFAKHKISLTSTNNEVIIDAPNPQKGFSFNNPFSRLRVDYVIAIPAKFDINVKTAGGNIEVGDLQGQAVVSTAGGDLKFNVIKGPLKARTSGGNITLSKSEGDADVSTSGGHLRLGEIEGNLVANTSGGNITLEKAKGTVKASTSGGDIRVKEAYGTITATTSGGNVFAQLNAQPKAACSLKTSGGNVEVKLDANLALDLSASTGGGRVSSDFPGIFNKEKTKLTAQMNGGGTDLVLKTSGGDVTIKKQ